LSQHPQKIANPLSRHPLPSTRLMPRPSMASTNNEPPTYPLPSSHDHPHVHPASGNTHPSRLSTHQSNHIYPKAAAKLPFDCWTGSKKKVTNGHILTIYRIAQIYGFRVTWPSTRLILTCVWGLVKTGDWPGRNSTFYPVSESASVSDIMEGLDRPMLMVVYSA